MNNVEFPGVVLNWHGVRRHIEECDECCVMERLCKLTNVLETADWSYEKNVIVEEGP